MNDELISAAKAYANAEREKGTKVCVLLPCNHHIFGRIVQNLPAGTLVRKAGTAIYDGQEWEVAEFYKPKHEGKTDSNNTAAH